MVFQNHLLFPYLTVGENVGFGLKMRGVDTKTIRQRVAELLEMVQLPKLAGRRPSELSGGQQQRVALARALIVEPTVLLLDEPLSNLDAHLREEMRELIRWLQRKLNMTTIVVTHDQEQAVRLADQIGLMFAGKLAQVGPPADFYERPSSRQVATFLGATNFLPAQKQGSVAETAVGPWQIAPSAVRDGPVTLTIRPEHVQIVSPDANRPNQVPGTVSEVIYAGTHTRLKVILNAQTCLTLIAPPQAAQQHPAKSAVWLHFPPEHLWSLPPDTA
jgi:ABC-type Fe3+/spermidine/putrescine transport system ATPase subunit